MIKLQRLYILPMLILVPAMLMGAGCETVNSMFSGTVSSVTVEVRNLDDGIVIAYALGSSIKGTTTKLLDTGAIDVAKAKSIQSRVDAVMARVKQIETAGNLADLKSQVALLTALSTEVHTLKVTP